MSGLEMEMYVSGILIGFVVGVAMDYLLVYFVKEYRLR
jgi:hypothetical protein